MTLNRQLSCSALSVRSQTPYLRHPWTNLPLECSHLRSLNTLLRIAAAVSAILTHKRGSPEKIGLPSHGTVLRSSQTARNCKWQQAVPKSLTGWANGSSNGVAMSRAPDGGGLWTTRLWLSELAPTSSVGPCAHIPCPTPPPFCNSSGLPPPRTHCFSCAITLRVMKSAETRQNPVGMVILDGKSVACAALHLRDSERSAGRFLAYFWQTGGKFLYDPERSNRHADNVVDHPTLRDAFLKTVEDEPELFLDEMSDVGHALTAGVDGAFEVSPASVSRILARNGYTRKITEKALRFHSQRGRANCMGCL